MLLTALLPWSVTGCAVGPVTKTTWGVGIAGVAAGIWVAGSGRDCEEFEPGCEDDDNTEIGLLIMAASLATAALFTPLAMTIDRGLLEADVLTPEDCDKISTSEWKSALAPRGPADSDDGTSLRHVFDFEGRGFRDDDYEPYEGR